MGLEQSHTDPCLSWQRDTEEIVATLVVRVDDLPALTTMSNLTVSRRGTASSKQDAKPVEGVVRHALSYHSKS